MPVTGPRRSAGEPAAELGSGVYVDVENLQTAAQEIIQTLVKSWPDFVPAPTLLSLYVRADQADLWSMWGENKFPHISVRAKGIQHFSSNAAKNSADIAIAIDAISDFLLRRINCVAVVSDDSDFISLYSKLREEQSQVEGIARNVPFLWVVTDRPKTRSTTMRDYFPNSRVFVVPFPKKPGTTKEKSSGNTAEPEPSSARANSVLEDMAQAIIEQIPVGKFKSTDCHKIIRRGWHTHALAKANEQSFGVEFRKELWDILKTRGVIEPNPNKQPRRYEMTQAAKATLG